jgi:hypothetical protein
VDLDRPTLIMNRLDEAFTFVCLSGLVGSLLFLTPVWAPEVVFRKLVSKQKQDDKSGIPPFSISDGFILITFLALGNSLLAMLLRNKPLQVWIVGLLIGVNLLVTLIWTKCQRFMWRNNIVQQRSRLFLQTVLYPMSVVVMGEMTMTVVIVLAAALQAFQHGLLAGINRLARDPMMIAAAVMLAIAIAAMLLIRYSFRKFIVVGSFESQPTNVNS